MLDQRRPGLLVGEPSIVALGLLLLVAVGALLALLSRSLTRPITALTEQAEQVAQGRFDHPVDAGGETEVRRLGGAFNRVTDELRRNAAALEQSRDDLRESLDRIGEALVSTHDIYGLLAVALETALTAAPARAGVVLQARADRSLELVSQEGLRDASMPLPTELSMGEGVLGRVAESGTTCAAGLGPVPPTCVPCRVSRRTARCWPCPCAAPVGRSACSRSTAPSGSRSMPPARKLFVRSPVRSASRSTTSRCIARRSGCRRRTH